MEKGLGSFSLMLQCGPWPLLDWRLQTVSSKDPDGEGPARLWAGVTLGNGEDRLAQPFSLQVGGCLGGG